MHSIYGLYNTMATNDSLLVRSNGELRPFSLSRSLFAGSQRYSIAVWTGDCRSDWVHFRLTLKQLLSISISGIPMVGSDVPGFYNDPTDE